MPFFSLFYRGLTDGVEALEDSPAYVFLDRSFYTDEKKACLIVETFGENRLRGQLNIRLLDAGQKEIEGKTVCLAAARAKVPLDIAALPPGDYFVETALDSGETNISTKLPLKKMDADNDVKLDRENRCLLVDGRSFIPMAFGMENIAAVRAENKSAWRDIAGHGFNTVCFIVRPSDSVSNIVCALDNMRENGLKAIFWLGPDDGATLAEIKAFCQKNVLRFRDHPALLAWYFLDEPDPIKWETNGKSEKDISFLYAVIKNADPRHPVFFNHGPERWAIGYGSYGGAGATDIFSRDEYPIGDYALKRNLEVSSVLAPWAFEIDKMTYDGLRSGKPVNNWLHLTQTPAWAPYYPREVTAMESRCQTYLALIHGTASLLYFIEKPMSVELWDSFIPLNREVSALAPVLTGGEELPEQAVRASDKNIHLLAKKYDGKIYIICANISESPVKVAFKLNSDLFKPEGMVEILFGQKNLKCYDYFVKDEFSGLEAKVYRLRDYHGFFRAVQDLMRKACDKVTPFFEKGREDHEF